MTSPSKEWKNPSDIMKTRRLQQHSSFSLSKTKSSLAISRRHSFTILSQNCENSFSPQLEHSQFETSSQSHRTGSQKRKNPFGCDLLTFNQSKRRSILNHDVGVEHPVPPVLIPAVSVLHKCLNEPCVPDREGNSALESKENRLLSALSSRDEKGDSSVSQKLETDSSTEVDKFDVLKEKPVIMNTEVASSDKSSKLTKVYPSPPLDWSLKSKTRVIVHSSIGQFKKYPGIDAKNVDSFIHHKLDNSQDWKDLDILQQIRRCCMHYSYPHLPWLSIFPRMSSDYKSRLPSVITSSKDVLDSLQKDWSSTLTSVYQQLRGGLCPYFYVCAHQFSVLFRCLRSHDHTSWSALLSPSTRGLRELLTKEGIEFRMPNIRCAKVDNMQRSRGSDVQSNAENDLLPLSQPDLIASDTTGSDDSSQKENTPRNDTDKATNEDDSSEDEADIAGDDEASRWLEGMGLDKKDFPSLEPFKVKLQREGYREIDHRPQSLILVEGVDVHSFFNFLLIYPACIASSGPQQGIPPTILSPVSFVGGRLVQNMVKHTTLSDGPSNSNGQVGSSRGQNTHVFEISGPMLPHHVLNIASILNSNPDSDSSTVSFSTHSPSAAFNIIAECNAEKDKNASGLSKLFVELSLANHGLLQDVKNQLLASPVLDAGTAVREIQVLKSGYSWSC